MTSYFQILLENRLAILQKIQSLFMIIRLHMNTVLYDEEADDFYITDVVSNFIQVYSSEGEHKRKLSLPEDINISTVFHLPKKDNMYSVAPAFVRTKSPAAMPAVSRSSGFDIKSFMQSIKDLSLSTEKPPLQAIKPLASLNF